MPFLRALVSIDQASITAEVYWFVRKTRVQPPMARRTTEANS